MNSKITKLPDGSAFFTANIMSKKEAMELPLKERPLCYRISNEMYMAVWEAIGLATNCVNEPIKAANIATNLCFKIAEEFERNQSILNSKELESNI